VTAEEARGRADAIAHEAEGRARATREQAQAEADSAALKGAAIISLAKADYERGEKEAAVRRMQVDAENRVSVPVLINQAARDFIHKAPEIVRELMKPAEKISELKILQVNGGGLSNGNGADAKVGMHMLGTGMNPLASTLLQAGAAYPIFKELLSFAKSAEGEKIVNVVKDEMNRLTPATSTNGGALDSPMATAPSTPAANVAKAKPQA
jgi:uncharacterized membrane protein YqiK